MNNRNCTPDTRPAPVVVQTRAVVPARTAHVFHIWMSLLTFGLWLPIYAISVLLYAGKTKTVTL
jgi:hypothetical protein